jgi:nickel-type superoxide dismutase maturation protease
MSTASRRLPSLLLGLGSLAALTAAAAAARRWLDVVEVHGRSMAPLLQPGDRLLVESRTYARRPPRAGEVVLAADPREPRRELVKRIISVDEDRGTADLRGDDPDASTDSRTFGSIRLGNLRWRVAARYWPPGRVSRL